MLRYLNRRPDSSIASVNRRVNKRKSGYTSAVSSAIMISAVAVIGSVLLVWASTSFSTQQQSIDNYYEKRSNSVKEAVVIEDVWFQSASPNYLNITLRNIGPIAISIKSVTVGSTICTVDGTSCTWTGQGIIGLKENSTVKVNFAWTSGQVYDIVVTTDRGSALRGIWKA